MKRLADRRVVALGSMTAALATAVGSLVSAPLSYAVSGCVGGQSYSAGYQRGDVVGAGQSVSVHIRGNGDLYPVLVGRLGSIRARILLENAAGTGFQVGLRDLGPGGSGLQAYVEYNGGGPGDIVTHGAAQGSQYTFKYTNNGNNSFTLAAFNSNWGISLTKTLSGGQHYQSYDTTSHQGTSDAPCNQYSFSFSNNSTYTRAQLNHYANPPYSTYADSSDPTGFTGWLLGV